MSIDQAYREWLSADGFDFSGAQREAILAAVQDGCREPDRFSFERLLDAVKVYRILMPHYRSKSRRSAAWRRVVRATKELRAALHEADVRRYWEKVGFDQGSGRGSSIWGALDYWESRAVKMSGRDLDSLRPREAFYEAVLFIWSDAGGFIRKSRVAPSSRNAGALGGPTIRYLQAVVVPVMGAGAPSAEGLGKIMDRFAARCEAFYAGYLQEAEAASLRDAQLEARRWVRGATRMPRD